MRILFPYLGRWQAPNRSRYHQLIRQLCLLGHEVFVLESPPSVIRDLSFTELEQGDGSSWPQGLHLGQAEVPRAVSSILGLPLASTKVLKKGLISLSSRKQVLRTIEREQIDVLWTYNLPQVSLLTPRVRVSPTRIGLLPSIWALRVCSSSSLA